MGTVSCNISRSPSPELKSRTESAVTQDMEEVGTQSDAATTRTQSDIGTARTICEGLDKPMLSTASWPPSEQESTMDAGKKVTSLDELGRRLGCGTPPPKPPPLLIES